MISLWTLFLLCLLLALLFGRLFYYFVYLPMTYFERVGVPGPKPTSYLTGSLSLLSKHKNFFNLQEALVKEYGNVVGYYIFQKPNLIVCDPDMVYEIIVKEFDKFVDRFESGSLTPVVAGGKKYHGLVFAAEDEWRLTRHSVTPAFSGRKIKQMEPLIKERTVKLSQKLLEFADTGKSVDMLDLFSKMTMEVIMSIAFGRVVDILGGQGGELYRNAKGLLDQYDDGGEVLLKVLVVIGNYYPSTKPFLQIFARNTSAYAYHSYLEALLRKGVNARLENESETQRMDLLQLLIEACRTEDNTTDVGMVVSTAIQSFLAGYDTTSNALSFTSYLLALHPDVQDRLAEEIHTHLSENPDQSLYDAVHEMEYLDMVFQESLRLYPPVPFIRRVCKTDCVIGEVPVKAGTLICIPMYPYHRKPDLWADADQFDPERFTSESKAGQHPYAHIPFGMGPRSCFGMRLGMLEAKMALIEVLNNYKLVRAPDTEVPMKLRAGLTLTAESGSVFLRLEKREWND